MLEELKQLKELRKKAEDLRVIDQALAEEYHASEEYQVYIANRENLDKLKTEIAALEEMIKADAVELSRGTGFEERDFGSVKVKEFTKVTITDNKLAIAWAALNAPSCLSLTRDFEKVAKTLELPFAKVEKEYRAQIASDLSALTD